MSTENERSQQFWKEPPKETSYEAHLRRKRLKQQQKARSARNQASEEQDIIETREVERDREDLNRRPLTGEDADTYDQTNWSQPTPLRPRPSSPLRPRPNDPSRTRLPENYTQESYETEPPSAPSRRRTRLPEDYREEDYEIETDLPREVPRQRIRSATDRDLRRDRLIEPTADLSAPARDRRTTAKTTRHLPQARQRKAWPLLLGGCAGGILTIALIVAIVLLIFFRTTLGGSLFSGVFKQTFTQQNKQTFNISNFSLIQLNNNVGNIASNVTITVDPTANATTLTTVKKVQADNSGDANKEFAHIPLLLNPVNPATPTLILTICSQGNTACGNIGDSVDVTLTLPTSTTTNGTYLFDIETRIGNLSMQQVPLAAGSCLSTGTGNVIFKGSLDTTNSSNLNPCGQPTSNAHPWYKLHSEVGNLDLTQLPTTRNVLLNASTTAGKIDSDGFDLKIDMSNGSEDYYGPLIANTPQPTAELRLDVGSGNITLHKL